MKLGNKHSDKSLTKMPKFEDVEIAKTTENVVDKSENSKSKFKAALGIRFPWCAAIFAVIGLLSEVVDAMFMNATLETLAPDIDSFQAICISAIIGASCFASMAFVGFQMGNPKYYSKKGATISYIFWASAGLALVIAKLLSGMVNTGDLSAVFAGEKSFMSVLLSEESLPSLIIALTQMVLYVGTGFMTRDSVRILTNVDMREYFLARRKYNQMLDELAEVRGDIISDIATLKIYEKHATRLLKSREAVLKNVAQYNESARAKIEAQMAITVEPDLMDGMYDEAMEKEGRPLVKPKFARKAKSRAQA